MPTKIVLSPKKSSLKCWPKKHNRTPKVDAAADEAPAVVVLVVLVALRVDAAPVGLKEVAGLVDQREDAGLVDQKVAVGREDQREVVALVDVDLKVSSVEEVAAGPKVAFLVAEAPATVDPTTVDLEL
jgi:hypothetical protein